MKKFLIFILILAAIYAAVKLSIKSPDQAIPSATEESTTTGDTTEGDDLVAGEAITADRIAVAFTGYGPGGKVENGSVKASGSTLERNGNIFSGSVTFNMNSITSTPVKEDLIKHLKSDSFFDAAKYPTATFTVTESTDAQVRGNLTMKGISQAVTLPVSYDPATGYYTSKVRIDMELFGIKQTFTDKEFVLTVTIQ